MEFFSAYNRPNYDGIMFDPDVEPSKTVQSQRDEADINVLVKRFGLTGQMPQSVRAPTFEDFGDVVFDFQSAQNAIIEANRSFMAMPAEVRSRFGNDPQAFVEFCSDEKNIDEMRKLGLAVPKVDVVESPVQRVVVVSENSDGSGGKSDGVRGGADASKATSGESGKGVE